MTEQAREMGNKDMSGIDCDNKKTAQEIEKELLTLVADKRDKVILFYVNDLKEYISGYCNAENIVNYTGKINNTSNKTVESKNKTFRLISACVVEKYMQKYIVTVRKCLTDLISDKHADEAKVFSISEKTQVDI